MRCNFPIVYGLKTTFTDGITLARSNKQYGPKWGIFNLYQIVCVGQSSESPLDEMRFSNRVRIENNLYRWYKA